MEIIDKYLSANDLIVVFDQAVPQDQAITVYVDNAEDYYSNAADDKHTYVFTDPKVSQTSVSVAIPSQTSALIIVTVQIADTKYVTMYFNKYMLFKAQNRYLAASNCQCCNGHNSCSSCDEKHWRTTTIAILLRTQLLNYAYENYLTHDAIGFYIDLCRVLDFCDVSFESIPKFYNTLDSHALLLF